MSAVFSALLFREWRARPGPSLLAWGVALAMFAAASLAAAVGLLGGWTAGWFRVYYLFGAILNVPVLGLGTVFLYGSRRLGRACTAVVVIASVGAAAAVLGADLNEPGLATGGIPRGAQVVPDGIRLLSRIYSLAGSVVVVGGALWSAIRLFRGRRRDLRDLAVANLLIAGGTFVVALGSGFAFRGRGLPFAVGLLAGVCLMFWGFWKTRVRAPARPHPRLVGGP
ncbi:MAG: hypothetical protein ACRDJ5_09325 [Actinomycetota bacterium]